MNPYDFVRLLERKPDRKAPHQMHDKFSGQSGRLICTLTACTPLFTPALQYAGRSPSHKRLTFHRVAGTPTLPGSSLKGVIRNMAEAAANA
ncbi:MAG: RAMP superfamily CRISPR-associated protein, partial [Blastocatellia bacterium]